MDNWQAILSAADGVGTVGIAVLVLVALLRGWLITPREAKLYRENEKIWRDAYNAKVAADTITREQFDELFEGVKLSRSFIEAFMKSVKG
jgi:hypothetical protein